MGWIIAYDITCQKRWRKVYKRIQQDSYRLQYSLFWMPGDMQYGNALADEIATLIDPKSDDIRFYPFARNSWARFYGIPPWTDGVYDELYRRFGDCWRARPS